jgi:outer membrane protein OmpA-like peptidoglycan-associated protein
MREGLVRELIGPLAAVACLALPTLAADVEGSADHPLVTRYPGATIEWYQVDNHREYRVPVDTITGYREIGEWIDAAGLVTRIYYEVDGASRSHGEVYLNYLEALESSGFEILARGLHEKSSRGPEVGTRAWQDVLYRANPFSKAGPVSAMVSGSSTSGGSGTVVARKERAAGTVYVVASVYRFRDDTISTLVDVVEVEEAETGLIVVDAEAIGRGLTEQGRVVLDGVLFEFDRATLRPESSGALEAIAEYLRAHPEESFYVVGHTDAKGAFAYNTNLSRERARAVAEALVNDHGIDGKRLEAHGVGPLVPVFSNETDAGREKNRRVELVER